MVKQSKLIGHLQCIACVIVWGSATVSSRIALNVLSPEELLLFWFLIGYITLWIILPKRLKLNSIKEELLCVLCGLCGVTLYFYFQNIALLYTAASSVSIINALSPMFTVILGFIITKMVSLYNISISKKQKISNPFRINIFCFKLMTWCRGQNIAFSIY